LAVVAAVELATIQVEREEEVIELLFQVELR
jgi:hypothetical protein